MSDERYGDAAQEYWNKGWRGIIPIPYKTKKLLLRGWTGHQGVDPSWPDIQAWIDNDSEADGARSNLALRLPPNVVGIDVDQYGAHSGERCLAEAERRWGVLPLTVRTTSRTDRISGIRLFKVPDGLEFEGEVKFPELRLDGIDIIQHVYRYAMAYPSVHPETKAQYLWLDDNCERVEIPSVADLPDLPEKWLTAITKDQTEITTTVNPYESISGFTAGRMDDRVNKVYMDAVEGLEGEKGARHHLTLGYVLHLIRLGTEGAVGVPRALSMLEGVYVTKTADRNSEIEARNEFRRMVYGERGHNLVASTPSAESVGMEMIEELERSAVKAEIPATDDNPLWNLLGATELGASDVAPTESDLDREMAELLGGTEHDPAAIRRDDLPFTQQLYRIGELGSIKPAEPLIDGLLFRNTLAQIAGPPGTYKSFFTLGLAMAVACPETKTRWNIRAIEHHGPVIYVAAEGLSGMRARALGWCQDQGVDHREVEIFFFPRAFQLSNAEDLIELDKMVTDTRAVLVVVDTRARVTINVDENKADEQAKLIDRLEAIRQKTGATFLMVHHSSRSGSAGRGSNAWDGAVWTELRSDKGGGAKEIIVECTKHKDAQSGCKHKFVMQDTTVDESSMPGVPERERKTLVCREVQDQEPTAQAEKNKQTMREAISAVLANAPGGGYTRTELKKNVAEQLAEEPKRNTFDNTLRNMKESGMAFEKMKAGSPHYGDRDTVW